MSKKETLLLTSATLNLFLLQTHMSKKEILLLTS